MRRECPITFAITGLTLAALLLGGCVDGPRRRIGSLPFPGFLTRYHVVEADAYDSLGKHQYSHVRFEHGDEGPEVDHGILYTCRAGFLDVAHIRTVVDWTWYARNEIRRALLDDRLSVRFAGPDLTWWDITFQRPESWSEMGPVGRTHWIEETSLRTGQRLAYLIMTWHEIVTWHGHNSVIIIPEDASAFTYDDGMSHLVGVRVAERAIRSGIENFDDAVTYALNRELEELEVVSRESARHATRLVRDDWWEARHVNRHHMDTGLDDGIVTPWTVPGLAECDGLEPESFPLPWFGQLWGHEGRIVIDTMLIQAGAIRASAGIPAGVPLEEKHILPLVAAIHEEMYRNGRTNGAP